MQRVETALKQLRNRKALLRRQVHQEGGRLLRKRPGQCLAASSQQRWALEVLPRLGTFSIHVTDEKEQARALTTGAIKTHNNQACLKRKKEGARDVAQLAQCWPSTHKGRHLQHCKNLAWWYMPVISALGSKDWRTTSWRSRSATYRVQGQPWLLETPSQKNNKKKHMRTLQRKLLGFPLVNMQRPG